MNGVRKEHLARAVDLAEQALATGNAPFGSVLVSGDGVVLLEEHNRIGSGDATLHPEFMIAKWATENLSLEERRRATVYTSGEHCPMCAAAHAFVGLGSIVYASSSEQLSAWRSQFQALPSPVAPLPIQAVAPEIQVSGPEPSLKERVKELQRRYMTE